MRDGRWLFLLKARPAMLRSEFALLILGVVALIASVMLWWANHLNQTTYGRHIVLIDNLKQAYNTVNRALLAEARFFAGEPVSMQDVLDTLDEAALKINDCIEGRSTLSGMESSPPSASVKLHLRGYQETFLQLSQTIRVQLAARERRGTLHTRQLREFHALSRAANILETAMAQDLASELKSRKTKEGLGLGCWLTFLAASFYLLYRAIGIESDKESQEQLIHSVLASTADAIFVKDRAGRYLFCNKAAQQFIGRDFSEFIGQDDYAAFPPEDAGKLMAIDRSILESGETSYHEEKLTTLQGDTLYFTVSKGVLRNREGETIGLFGISRDITRQTASEEQLHRHQFILERTSRLAKVGGWEFNPATMKGWWTRECAAIHGLEWTPEVSADTGLSYYVGEHREIIEKAIHDAIAAGHPYDLELEMLTARGERKWVRTLCEPVIKDGRVEHLYGAIQDITERKFMEDNLRDSEIRYRTLFERSLDAIALMDSYPPRFRYVNPSFVHLFGYSQEEVLNMTGDAIWSLVYPEDQSVVQKSLKERMEGRSSAVLYEFRIVRKDGQIRWVEASGSRTELGRIIINQSFYRDITARKQAEDEREKLRNQLIQAQKLESIGRLAGGVAHDFNNMLNVILGYSEMVLEKLVPGDNLYHDLEEILKAGQRSAGITRQLLAFARKQAAEPQAIDLNETVEGMLKMLRRLIGENINLIWSPSKQQCPVWIDPSQVDQVLANLCVNAKDAISGIGSVTIETGNVDVDENYTGANFDGHPGKYVLLAVSDNGSGMDKETMDNIFEPFFTTKSIGKGTGLGLATIYGIVRQNNGFVNVYSEPGRGTIFKIYLPYHGKGLRVEQEDDAVAPPESADATVLLVEDETSLLHLDQRMLEKLGYTVLAASRPGEALNLAREHGDEIDLLLTDVVMPEMNGHELAIKVKELIPRIRQVYMSGYTANVILDHGVLAEGGLFLQKPFTKQELAAKLRAALE